MEKLDLNRFDEKTKNFILELKDVLTNQDPSRVEEHLELAKRAPSGIYDDWYLESPATSSLIMYGEVGLDALYRLSIIDAPVSGKFLAPRILLCNALRISRIPVNEANLAQTYLDDSVFETLIKKIKTNCEELRLSKLAQSMLEKVIQHFMVNPSYAHDLGYLFDMTIIFDQEKRKLANDLLLQIIAKNTVVNNENLEEIRHQQGLLITYRRNLRHLLQQAALHGGEVYSPLPIINQIGEQRTNINKTKEILRNLGEQVIDYPNEELTFNSY